MGRALVGRPRQANIFSIAAGGLIAASIRIRAPQRGQDLTPEVLYRQRLERAPAIWEAMKAKADELKALLLPKSTPGKAVNYFVNDYDALKGYLRDGRYEIDNNFIWTKPLPGSWCYSCTEAGIP